MIFKQELSLQNGSYIPLLCFHLDEHIFYKDFYGYRRDYRHWSPFWYYRGFLDSTNFVLPGNHTIEKSYYQRELNSNKYIECTFKKDVSWRLKGKKPYYIKEFVLFSMILNCTIPGIVLSEIILSRDLLYCSLSQRNHPDSILNRKLNDVIMNNSNIVS